MTCNKKHIIYPDFTHEYLKDHDELIFKFFTED